MKTRKLIPIALMFGTLALTACGGGTKPSSKDSGSSSEEHVIIRPGADDPWEDNATGLNWDSDSMQESVLGAYDAKYQAANAVVDPAKTVERFEKFAEAEYNLIYEEGIIVPWLEQNGWSASVSKSIPYRAGRASYGLTGDKWKNVIVTNAAITKEQRAAVVAEYEALKETPIAPHEPDAQGWISLANDYPNGSKTADGKYTAGGIAFQTKSEMKTSYATEPTNDLFNYLTNTWTYNSEQYTNMVEGLIENDRMGNTVGCLAESYKVIENEDGTETWKFKLREGVKWVRNNNGQEYAEVKAKDFVAGIKYVLDPRNGSGSTANVTNFVKNAKEYLAGTITDFDEVGVKAEGDYIVSYTLTTQTPYFLSCLTYSPYLPVNEDFLEEAGSDFGKTENNILVNGAFRMTEHVANTRIVLTKNASYWDKDHVYLDTVNQIKVPNTAGYSWARTMYENGDIDGFSVRQSDSEGWSKYVVGNDPEHPGSLANPAAPDCNAILGTGSTTYIGYFNFNRWFWETDTEHTDKDTLQKFATSMALLDKDFRLGFLYGLDVMKQLSMYNEDAPYEWLYRAFTNRELAAAGGKDYADYVDDVYNEKQGLTGDDKVTLTGINQGGDPIFNVEKARTHFNAAKNKLLASGLLTEEDFPITIDVLADMSVEVKAFEDAMYAPFEENFGDIIQIRELVPATEDQNSGWGSIDCNFDFSLWSGWGPDYADPNTYMHCFCIDGDMVNYLGF